MRDATIARNYAEALLALARKGSAVDLYAGLIESLATAVRETLVLRRFLEAPQIADGDKRVVLQKALGDSVPRPFLLFLERLVTNRRQTLIPDIAVEFGDLVDEEYGRVHATVTVAQRPKDGDADRLSEQLSEALQKEVIAHIEVNPAILGGLVVRVGDTVMDGSVRRRLGALRHALLSAGS